MIYQEYSRCIKCGNRMPKVCLIQYKLRNYCKNKPNPKEPSCYMAELLKDLELLKQVEKYK